MLARVQEGGAWIEFWNIFVKYKKGLKDRMEFFNWNSLLWDYEQHNGKQSIEFQKQLIEIAIKIAQQQNNQFNLKNNQLNFSY